MKEFLMKSHGKGNIACTVWEPYGEVRGIVQIVHGIAEYIKRYDALAQVLNEHGFLVAGDDHMGHGASINDQLPRGHFEGGWFAAVDDSYALTQKLKEEYPDVPIFLYGHSMGSFMARTIAYRYPDAGFAGLILSGTGWQPKPVLSIGRAICKAEAKKKGRTATSQRINNLMFGSYNKSYPNVRTRYDWISSDNDVVDRYCADELAGFDTSVGLADDMLTGLQMNEKKENLEKMPKSLPVYFFSGACDPVGAMGKGVTKTVAAFRKAGMIDVTVQLYPNGRHEMHNEVNKEQVYEDILAFLNKHI